MTYQEIFTEFIEYQRTHPLPSLIFMDAITFDKHVAVVRKPSTLSPLNIAGNASNTSDPWPTQRVMKIQRAPIAKNHTANKQFQAYVWSQVVYFHLIRRTHNTCDMNASYASIIHPSQTQPEHNDCTSCTSCLCAYI
eukprot:905677_1